MCAATAVTPPTAYVHALMCLFIHCINLHISPRRFEKCADLTATATPPQPTYGLVLRQWTAIEPAMEFRCFVRARQLVHRALIYVYTFCFFYIYTLTCILYLIHAL